MAEKVVDVAGVQMLTAETAQDLRMLIDSDFCAHVLISDNFYKVSNYLKHLRFLFKSNIQVHKTVAKTLLLILILPVKRNSVNFQN